MLLGVHVTVVVADVAARHIPAAYGGRRALASPQRTNRV